MNEIDKLLQQVKAEYQPDREVAPKSSPKQESTNSVPPQKLVNPMVISTQPIADSGVDNLLADLSQEYQEQDRQQELAQQQQKARQQQQQKAALEKSAKKWLKQLDPHSNEGLWFTEFAYAYDSQLAAAIDYLQAMQETKQKP